MWLGEQITNNGIGNGLSLIITASILTGAPSAIGKLYNFVSIGESKCSYDSFIYYYNASGSLLSRFC